MGEGPSRAAGHRSERSFRQLVTELSDQALTLLLGLEEGRIRAAGHRQLMTMIKTSVVAYLNRDSDWYRSAVALEALPMWLGILRELQAEEGLFNSGDNLASPPDSSFTVNDMVLVHQLVDASPFSEDAALVDLSARLSTMMARVTPALVSGGVHTPNHRWEIASALARLDALSPDASVQARIEEWLAEGVDMAPDGLYSERSPNYAAHVTNPCLIALAEHLRDPDLLEIVHRNLHAQAVLTDVDGFVETVHSRRQDQGKLFSAAPFAIQYRRFALLHGCGVCAGAAMVAQRGIGHDESITALAELLAQPTLGDPLPERSPTALATQLHAFPSAGLVRIGRGESTTTIYGGSDVRHAGRIGSGLACDPTFLRWRRAAVHLDSVRLSRNFFGLGPFRAQGLDVLETGLLSSDDRVCRLHERVTAAYYQPLGSNDRSADGSYALEYEGRFAAAMSFSRRDRTKVQLETDLEIISGTDSLMVNATFTGAETSYAFELTFRPGGTLTGTRRLPEHDCFELVDGFGSYRVGNDVVTFGPGHGSLPDRHLSYDPGEAYAFLHGTDATSGVRVYLTGRTPGTRTLILRTVS